MPLADRATVAVLTSLQQGVWTQLSAVPTPVEHGFDALDVVWVADFRNTAKTALEVAAAFPQGARYGSADFWLRSATPERVAGNVWKVSAHYEGRIANTKPLSVRMMSTNEVFSVEELTYTGLFTDAPVNVRECSPSVEIGYVLVDAAPPTHLVGLSGVPAVSPSVRSGFWGGLTEARYNFPSGWVFTDVDSDKIAGASPQAHFVRESWQYFQFAVPA